jgi:hypothetical protein
MCEAFVVAEVEVCFGAVVSDEDLAVLKWRHRTRIDVDVRVEFDQCHAQSAALEQTSDR